jgi:hypothetical protein
MTGSTSDLYQLQRLLSRRGFLGRDPSAPSQAVLESSVQSADGTQHSNPAG